MSAPTYSPWSVVHLVMTELARTGIRSRYQGEDLGAAAEAAAELLRALNVDPVTVDDIGGPVA